jgi:DNA mismatch repair protein MutL
MVVRYLDQTLINQIAAGEVIERPASAIKELVENALDAGATRVDVLVRDGGRTLLVVSDNGSGMRLEDLVLSVERHATSKIPDGDLFNIRTLGFRGEALPSIGSVSRLMLTTRQGDGDAWQLSIEGGKKSEPQPVSAPPGTRVEVRDLFYATPARLKFLKSPTTELNHITDIIHRQALSNLEVDFTLRHDDRLVINFTKGVDRLNNILGKDFRDNALQVDFQRDESRLTGWVSIPTYNRSYSTDQYLFVNGRSVKDKMLAIAIKIAYQDVLAGNRYPCVCLFLECAPEDVDLNVHPAKAEVRFRDPNLMKGFVVAGIREALHTMASQTSTHLSEKALMAFDREISQGGGSQGEMSLSSPPSLRPRPRSASMVPLSPSRLPLSTPSNYAPLLEESPPSYRGTPPFLVAPAAALVAEACQPEAFQEDHPLGYAKAQIHSTYIVAEAADALVLVDQHAAHERLVYEKMKRDLANGLVKTQALLIPVVVETTAHQLKIIQDVMPTLNRYGFRVDCFGQSLVIREAPSLLALGDLKPLLLDLASELVERGTDLTIEETLHEILAEKACKNSIRAGRRLSIEEMNALLREMEKTPLSNQCNHGRPTFIKLSKSEMEKLFERA